MFLIQVYLVMVVEFVLLPIRETLECHGMDMPVGKFEAVGELDVRMVYMEAVLRQLT